MDKKEKYNIQVGEGFNILTFIDMLNTLYISINIDVKTFSAILL